MNVRTIRKIFWRSDYLTFPHNIARLKSAGILRLARLPKWNLTDVQRQKAQCIKQLAELRSMSGGGKSELVDDWVAAIQAAEEMDDDAP